LKEVALCQKLQKGNFQRIVQFFDSERIVTRKKGELIIKLEYGNCNLGECLEIRKNNKDLYSQNEAIIIFWDLITGLSEAKSINICHCDVKPANCILCEEKGDACYKFAD